MTPYKNRKIEFQSVFESNEWNFKIYTITSKNRFRSTRILEESQNKLKEWILKANLNEFENYQVGCLIIHETDDIVFIVLNWWVDENILQNHVFIASESDGEIIYEDYSKKGIQFCVWEMAVIWFERNCWIENILTEKPNFENYLSQHYSHIDF